MLNSTTITLLKSRVKKINPLTIEDSREEVRKEVDKFFKEIIWSAAKDEWDNHMTETDKVTFCDLLSEYSR